LNKMEQVLGRGVRTCSHSLLPEALRNCTIHLLVNTYGDAVETADLYMYRNATMKALQIGMVTRVLKRYAVDCNLNYNAIFIKDMVPLDRVEDSQGGIRRRVTLNDTPFTSICDWMECKYACAKPIDVEKYLKSAATDMSSYDEYAMRWRESQIKKIIRALFESEGTPMIQIDSLVEALRTAEIPELAIRTILSEIVGQPSFRLRIGGQEGYIIYRNTYYLFQPIRLADVRIPLALRVADVPVRKDEYNPQKIEYRGPLAPATAPVADTVAPAPKPLVKAPGTKEVAEPPPEPSAMRAPARIDTTYWDACVVWSQTIRDATSGLDIPDDVLTAIEARYTADDYKREYNCLTMISWMYENISRSPDIDGPRRPVFLDALAETLLKLVWDESLKTAEQYEIFQSKRSPELDIAISEQLVKRGTTEAFRFVNLATGAIEYQCPTGKCSEAVVRLFESEPAPQANRSTTGRIYGLILPKLKDARLTFKTNNRPVDPGVAPEKGGECEIVSSIEKHKILLRDMRTMITDLGYPPFLLTPAVLEEKGEAVKEKKKAGELTALQKTQMRLKSDRRKFQNVQKACALTNILLRMIDSLEVKASRKRYFYRPIAAIKSKHRLK